MSTVRLLMVGIGWWIALFAFWLFLVAKLQWSEAMAGGIAAILAAVAAVVIKKAGGLRYRPVAQALRHLAPVPLNALRDCGVLGLALWRRLMGKPVHGVFRAVPFDPGEDDPRSAARRAMVTLGMTFAPNTIAVSIDHDLHVLLTHQLVPTAEPPGQGNREWPL